jgi:hypothetical protein
MNEESIRERVKMIKQAEKGEEFVNKDKQVVVDRPMKLDIKSYQMTEEVGHRKQLDEFGKQFFECDPRLKIITGIGKGVVMVNDVVYPGSVCVVPNHVFLWDV